MVKKRMLQRYETNSLYTHIVDKKKIINRTYYVGLSNEIISNFPTTKFNSFSILLLDVRWPNAKSLYATENAIKRRRSFEIDPRFEQLSLLNEDKYRLLLYLQLRHFIKSRGHSRVECDVYVFCLTTRCVCVC